MSDLIEFLRARLDEDERIASDALEHGSGTDHRYHAAPGGGFLGGIALGSHHYRHNPTRELSVVKADRAIVALYERQAAKASENAMQEDRAWTLEPVLCHLAAIWSDHPDYLAEWRPL